MIAHTPLVKYLFALMVVSVLMTASAAVLVQYFDGVAAVAQEAFRGRLVRVIWLSVVAVGSGHGLRVVVVMSFSLDDIEGVLE